MIKAFVFSAISVIAFFIAQHPAHAGMKIGIVDNSSIPARMSSELGVTVQRYDVMWNGEPTFTGRLNFSPGVQPIVSVYGRAWNVPQTDVDRSQYCNFISSILSAYPQIMGIVVWNEPDGKKGHGYNWPEGLGYSVYGRMLQTCSPAIRSFGAKVIGPGMHPTEGLYDTDADTLERTELIDAISSAGSHLLDAWDLHLYGHGLALSELIRSVRYGMGWNIPVWITEDGMDTKPAPEFAPLYTGTPWGEFWDWNSEADQESAIPMFMLNAYCAGASMWMNFKLIDETDLQRWQSGVLRPDGSRKLAFRAFAITASVISNTDCDSPVRVPPFAIFRSAGERIGLTREARGQGWIPIGA
jgi:hypothetical protein